MSKIQNSLRSDSCIFDTDADSCELRVSRHPANAIRGSLFPELVSTSLERIENGRYALEHSLQCHFVQLWDSTPSALGFFRLRLWDSSPSALGFLAFGSRVPRLRLFRLGIMIVMRAMPESPESEPIPDFDFYRDSVVGINLAAGISLLDWLVITEAGRYSFKRRSEIPVANIMKNPKFLSKFAL